MATLSRWDPFGDMQRLTERMLRDYSGSLEGRAFSPAVDIYEDSDAIYMKAELPGIKPDDVSIDVENHVLTLRGERKLEREDKREGYRRIESSYGAFTRSFALPEGAETEKVEAEIEDGVLKLRIPKQAEAATKNIPIKKRETGKETKQVVSAAEPEETQKK
jgi:HSP20 family protein